jgi:hypothetical protein
VGFGKSMWQSAAGRTRLVVVDGILMAYTMDKRQLRA